MQTHAQPAKAQSPAKGSEPKKIGDKVKENFACVLANTPNTFHSVPVPTAYVLLYRYRSAAGVSDNSDSIALLNTIIADLAPLTKSYGIYLECMSFNPVPSRNQECLKDVSEKSKWINKSNKTDGYFAIYPVVVNNQKTPSSILNAGKLTLIGPDGTILAIASHLGNFHYDPLAAKPESLKGKPLKVDGVEKPGAKGKGNRLHRGNTIKKQKISYYVADYPRATYEIPNEFHHTLLYRYMSREGVKDNADSIMLLNGIVERMTPPPIDASKYGPKFITSCDLAILPVLLNADPKQNSALKTDFMQVTKFMKGTKRNIYSEEIIVNTEPSVDNVLAAGKLVLLSPRGEILATSDYLSNFNYEFKKTAARSSTIKGKLLTENNGVKTPVSDAPVFLLAANKDTLSKATTDKFGDFELSKGSSNSVIQAVPKNSNLQTLILATQEGKEISRFRKTATGFEYKLIQADIIKLSDMPVSDDISLSFKKFAGSGQKEMKQIENIDYGLSKYDVSEEAKSVLNKIVTLMNENPGVKLEIISHTDAQGDDASNLELSVKRANAVADFLVSKGIARTRLTALGKGETSIRNRCTNNVECSETEHRYNRRTEFRFIKT